jgi:hypothetical protein
MIGDIWTDSGFLTGIGGCPTQNQAATFADPDHHGRRLRGRAPVLLLERQIA